MLFGFLLALGGAEIFELVGLKGDLGALLFGFLIADHVRADEISKTMLGFKDLFLLGFFLSIGMSGEPTWDTLVVGLIFFPWVLFKFALFYGLLTRFRLRARTALLGSVNLANFSEFGLIVVAIGVEAGWLSSAWLVAIALALSLSYVLAAALNAIVHRLYVDYKPFWQRFQRQDLLEEDRLLDLGGASIAIIGMGGVGSGAYDSMRLKYGDTVVGVDIDPITARNQRALKRDVILGDPSDTDFWDRIHESHALELVMIALPNLNATLEVVERLHESFAGLKVAATARFPDEVEALESAGVSTVFNVYTEAGAGFAAHVNERMNQQLADRINQPL